MTESAQWRQSPVDDNPTIRRVVTLAVDNGVVVEDLVKVFPHFHIEHFYADFAENYGITDPGEIEEIVKKYDPRAMLKKPKEEEPESPIADENTALYYDPEVRAAVPRAAFAWGGQAHPETEAYIDSMREKGLTLEEARKLFGTLNSRRGPDRMGK